MFHASRSMVLCTCAFDFFLLNTFFVSHILLSTEYITLFIFLYVIHNFIHSLIAQSEFTLWLYLYLLSRRYTSEKRPLYLRSTH